MDFKPTKDNQIDQLRRVRMQLVIRNFLQRICKDAYTKMESYSYFWEAKTYKGLYSSLPVLGILIIRNNKRAMEASICVSQNGIILPKNLEMRMDYVWAYVKQKVN